MTNSPVPVFDGHNDVLLRLRLSDAKDPVGDFLDGRKDGHIDLPRAREGGLAGGLCAIYVPSPSMAKDQNGDFPTPAQPEALNQTIAMARILLDIERRSNGGVKVCRTADDLRRSIATGSFAAVMHIEGAEAIAGDLDALYVLHQAGLRTLGPVWSRPNIFAYGVPFKFPSTPDIGPGLSDAGRDLIRACNDLRIMVDLSHLNEAGFWDVAKISKAPLVASHSNAHALSAHSRNLTDRQLDAIRDTGGLVGINFGVLFLRDDGRRDESTSLDVLVRHIAYIAERIGINHVALGSDFDGTTVPSELKDASGLPCLIEALRKHGFSSEDIAKIAFENWIDVLGRSWAA